MAEPLDVGAVVVTYRLDRDESSFAKYKTAMAGVVKDAEAAEAASNFTYSVKSKGGSLKTFAKNLEAAGRAAQQYGPALRALHLAPTINNQAVSSLKVALKELKREALETYQALQLVNGGLNPAPLRAAGKEASAAARQQRAAAKAIQERAVATAALGDAEAVRRRRVGLDVFGADGVSSRGPSAADTTASNVGRKINANTRGLDVFGPQLQGSRTREVQRSLKAQAESWRSLRQTAVSAQDGIAKGYDKVVAADTKARAAVGRPIGPAVNHGAFNDLKRRFNEAQTFAFRFARDMQLPVRFAMKWIGTTVAAIGGPLTAAGISAAKFSDEMTKIQVVAGASAAEVAKLSQQALTMATEGRRSALELAQAQNELIKGGMSAAQVYSGGLDTALTLSTVAQIEMAEAAMYTSNAMNLFGVSAKDSMKIANSLSAAANETTASVSDMGMALSQGGSSAKMVGMELEDTTAILMALAKLGVKNSDAGTSFKSAIVQATGGLSPRARNLMDALGLSLFNANGQMKDAVELTKSLEEAMAGLNKEEQITALTQIFGSDGFRTAIAMLEVGADGMRNLVKVQKEANAEAKKAKMDDTLMGQFERLGNTINSVAIQVFRPLEPKVKAFVKDLQKSVLSLKKPLQKFAEDVGDIVFSKKPWEEKWDLLWQRIMDTGIPDKVVNALVGVIVKMLNSAFSSIGSIFMKADWFGRAFIAGLLFVKVGPAAAAMAGLLVRMFGAAFGKKAVAQSFAGGMSGVVANGAMVAGPAGGAMVAGKGGRMSGLAGRIGGGVNAAAGAGSRVLGAASLGALAVPFLNMGTDALGMGTSGDILSSAAGGAIAGATFGPWGAAVGAALGAAIQVGVSSGLFGALKDFVTDPSTDELAKQFGDKFGTKMGDRAASKLSSAMKRALDQQEKDKRLVIDGRGMRYEAARTDAGTAANRNLGATIAAEVIAATRRSGRVEDATTIMSRLGPMISSKNEGMTPEARSRAAQDVLAFVAQQVKSGRMGKLEYARTVNKLSNAPDLRQMIIDKNLVHPEAALKLKQVNDRLLGIEARAKKVKEQFRLTTSVVGLTAENAARRIQTLVDELSAKMAKLSPADKARAQKEARVVLGEVRDIPGASIGATITGAPGASIPVRVHSDEVIMNRKQIDMVGRDRIMSVLGMTGAQSLRAGGSYAGGATSRASKRARSNPEIMNNLHPGSASAQAQAPTELPDAAKFRRIVAGLDDDLAKAERTKQPNKALKIEDTKDDDKRVLKRLRSAYEARIRTLEGYRRNPKYKSQRWQDIIREELTPARRSAQSYADQIRQIGRDFKDAKTQAASDAIDKLLPSEVAVDNAELAFQMQTYETPGLSQKQLDEMEKEQAKKLFPMVVKAYNDVKAAWTRAKGAAKKALEGRMVDLGEQKKALEIGMNAAKSVADKPMANPVQQLSAARMDLYREFGSNSRPMPVGGNFAGYQAGLAGSGGANPRGTMVTQNITIAQPPPDPLIFSRKLAFELRGAI